MSDETRAEPLNLDAIKARADLASYGPWQVGPSWAGKGAVLTAEGHPVAVCGAGKEAARDANFIAHARWDVLDLVREVERLREQLEYYTARPQPIRFTP